jgi:hypothetical protein
VIAATADLPEGPDFLTLLPKQKDLYCGLTWFGGRDYRLADVDGYPIRGILA